MAVAVAFLTPNLVAYILFLVIPAVTGVVLSFFSWDLFTDLEWVGLANYERMAQDGEIPGTVARTFAFLLLGVVPTVIIGFSLAVLSNWRAWGIGALRTLYFLPLIVSTAVAGVIWSQILDARNGVLNELLRAVGLPGAPWLGSVTWALPALSAVLVWLSIPLVVILYLAGLQRVPPQLYEAAQLDGAGVWRRMWQISWPSVAPTTVLVVGLQLLHFLGAPFEAALIMTGGGPLESTTSLSLYSFQWAFDRLDIGYASALSMLQFFIVLLIMGVIWLAFRRRSAQ